VPRPYPYVGPDAIRDRHAGTAGGRVIASAVEMLAWLGDAERDHEGLHPAPFVIDAEGRLRLAPRRSEHVACAGGGPVRSAGEMFFAVDGKAVALVEVSNHSTRFCPEPESWPEVAAALERCGIANPGQFTAEVIFRRCPACGERNLVKASWYHCGICEAELPNFWNFQLAQDEAEAKQ
jgi:hypothetical protein